MTVEQVNKVLKSKPSKVIFVREDIIFYGYTCNENYICVFIKGYELREKSFNADILLPDVKNLKTVKM